MSDSDYRLIAVQKNKTTKKHHPQIVLFVRGLPAAHVLLAYNFLLNVKVSLHTVCQIAGHDGLSRHLREILVKSRLVTLKSREMRERNSVELLLKTCFTQVS